MFTLLILQFLQYADFIVFKIYKQTQFEWKLKIS